MMHSIAANRTPVCTSSPASGVNSNETHSDEENVVIKEVLTDLERFRDQHGNYHEKVAETLNSLGLIRLHMQRNPEDARPYFEEALRIYELTGDPSGTSVTLHDLAYCYERLQQTEQALELYQRAQVMQEGEEKLGPKHPRLLSTQRSVWRLLRS